MSHALRPQLLHEVNEHKIDGITKIIVSSKMPNYCIDRVESHEIQPMDAGPPLLASTSISMLSEIRPLGDMYGSLSFF